MNPNNVRDAETLRRLKNSLVFSTKSSCLI